MSLINAKLSNCLNTLTMPRVYLRILFVLLSTLGVISFNITLHAFKGNENALGNYVYLFGAINWMAFVSMAMICLEVLVGRYLLEKRYNKFLLWMFVGMLFLVRLPFIELRIFDMLSGLDKPVPDFGPMTLLENWIGMVQCSMCYFGGCMLGILNRLKLEDEKMAAMEQDYLSREVMLVKNQVNPDLLFSTLISAGNLAGKDSDRSSDMLMRLSQVLRYQLYDCSRHSVLLNSEIAFLRNSLELHRYNNPHLNYNIDIQGNPSSVLVAPLLFVPFIESVSCGVSNLTICFVIDDYSVLFICQNDAISADKDYTMLMQRLDMIYKDNYKFTLREKGEVRLLLNV